MSDPLPRAIRQSKRKVTDAAREATRETAERATDDRATNTADAVLGQSKRTSEDIAESLRRRQLDESCLDGVCLVAYRIPDGDGAVYYAENETYYDIDMTVDLIDLEDYTDELKQDSKRQIIPPKTGETLTRVKIYEFKPDVEFNKWPIPGFNANLGDPSASHTAPGYTLPFPTGGEYECTQAFGNSDGTHNRSSNSRYAVDFAMPIGSRVTAARRGVVASIGWGRRDAWTVTLRHDDGTYGEYVHLKKESQTVKEGDQVRVGETIAESGNTGETTSGPHLHFHVKKADGTGGWETVRWEFDGTKVEVNGNEPDSDRITPKEGRSYRRTQ